ncbi:hypothetical protein DVB69_09895 [Sporosarcina sp. BI001-red]|uniref:hypothetical protein n=1 Tax=Sporosarcina sp. BI001-red TaxID=2282866 RepID=UPI000E24B5B2|nr:hypothetical protein [Sporosarcina sp. BI001-red]REB07157.1 hypothetical protein DVB69_09895 [Sporosarcina sp. BI001-red]
MEPTQWTLTETFQFPAEYGKAVSAQEVKVTAGYTEHQTEDAVRLSGIYHVAANVGFDGEGQEAALDSDAILIDDVDVQEKSGYFEYAVPLLVDLPTNEDGQLKATVIDASATATDDGALTVMWTVEAKLAEVEAVAKNTTVGGEQAEPQTTTAAVTAGLDSSSVNQVETTLAYSEDHEMLAFISDLEDDVTVTSFRLNDVFVE